MILQYRRMSSWYHLIFSVYIILPYLVSTVVTIEAENRDNPALDPVKLIDLVLKEEAKLRDSKLTDNFSRKMKKSHELFASTPNSVTGTPVTIITESLEGNGEGNKKVDPLKARKVWSRWSKWGKCTVSCGEGVIARKRVCVAGRCANGEAEEQRRPCRLPPCLDQDTATEMVETNDLE